MLTAIRYLGPPVRSNTASKPMIFTCSDRENYIIKFHGLPGQAQMLINELLAHKLAVHLGLPTMDVKVVYVPPQLIENEQALINLKVKGGYHFGSKFNNNLAQMPLSAIIGLAENKHVIPSIIGFDHWINNWDRCCNDGNILLEKTSDGRYNIIIIDHGHAFSGPQWTPEMLLNLADEVKPIPIRGTAVYGELASYVIGTNPFDPIIDQILKMDAQVIIPMFETIPDEWGLSQPHKDALITFLDKRRTKLGSTLYLLRDQFPNWKGGQVQWKF